MASELNKLQGNGPFDTAGSGTAGIVSVSGIGRRLMGLPNGASLYVTEESTITANTTTTSAPAGSIVFGPAGFFQSDGSKWQFITVS